MPVAVHTTTMIAQKYDLILNSKTKLTKNAVAEQKRTNAAKIQQGLSNFFEGLTKNYQRCDKKLSQARQKFVTPMITVLGMLCKMSGAYVAEMEKFTIFAW